MDKRPEFIEEPPCTKEVKQRGTSKLLGYCTRRAGHPGGCTPVVNDRTVHYVR